MYKLIILLLCIACGRSENPLQEWFDAKDQIRVLSTTTMVNDLVKSVGGKEVITAVMIQGNLDPHTYQLVKGDDEKLQSAELIFYNGLGLEHGASLKSFLRKTSKAKSLGNVLLQNYPDLILSSDGVPDPHIWMDISLFSKTIPLITKALSEARPEKKAFFENNAANLQKSLQKAHESVLAITQSIPNDKRYLVTSHDAFNYFARGYLKEPGESNWQERSVAPEGLAPESQLSVLDIFEIIEHLKKYQVSVLFTETNVSKDSIRKILSAGNEKGLNLTIAKTELYGDAMGPGDTYLEMIEHNAKAIAHYLGGQ